MTRETGLRSLAEKATPGPWIRPWGSMQMHGIGGDFDLTQEDLDYCAALVNAAPELLTALERAIDAMDTVREGLLVTEAPLAITIGAEGILLHAAREALRSLERIDP